MLHERISLNPDDERVFIDTYVHNFGTARDAILVIPGGAYREVCTDREGEPIALAFVAKGFNAFVLGYRVGNPDDNFPKQLFDAAEAMVYIREHAKELKINPRRVFAVGFSAGGHLCGSISTMWEFPEVKERFGDRAALVRPTASVLSYPVTTLYGPTHINSFKNLLGKPDGDFTDAERERYSLECCVNQHTAPIFIWHTAEDTVVPAVGSLRLARALIDAKIPSRLSIYPYGKHGSALANAVTARASDEILPMADGWVDEAIDFFKTLADY